MADQAVKAKEMATVDGRRFLKMTWRTIRFQCREGLDKEDFHVHAAFPV
jgi:hypothetical protein